MSLMKLAERPRKEWAEPQLLPGRKAWQTQMARSGKLEALQPRQCWGGTGHRQLSVGHAFTCPHITDSRQSASGTTQEVEGKDNQKPEEPAFLSWRQQHPTHALRYSVMSKRKELVKKSGKCTPGRREKSEEVQIKTHAWLERWLSCQEYRLLFQRARI